MSVQDLIVVALSNALTGDAAVSAGITGVFTAPPMRAARPFAQIDQPVLADWSTKDQRGREARITVLLRDEGEVPDRLRALAGAAETAIEATERDIGEGWRIASLVFVRSRIVAEAAGRWSAMIEYRLRLLQAA